MGLFPTTQWGMVLDAGKTPGTDSRASLEMLCGAYWQPLYAYARLGGRDPEEALDLTQGFFAHLLERELIAVVDPGRGSFRAFLKTAFDNYSSNERRTARAQKRGAGEPTVSFDLEDAESRLRDLQVDAETPDLAFERHWARTLLRRSVEQLGAEMRDAGEEERFRALSPFLTGEETVLPYRDVAARLDITESAVKVAVHRLRRRFGALLRREISQTVPDESAVDDELRHVLRVLGG
jgi:RNA polymerase sigma-70 factor (ECF subfamily)